MDWERLLPGQRVCLADGFIGEVKVNLSTKTAAVGFDPSIWDDDEGGVLFQANFGGLVKYSADTLTEMSKSMIEKGRPPFLVK